MSTARKGLAPMSSAERQAKMRRERDAAGLVEVRNLWVHPDDVEAVRQLARDLAKARELAKRAG